MVLVEPGNRLSKSGAGALSGLFLQAGAAKSSRMELVSARHSPREGVLTGSCENCLFKGLSVGNPEKKQQKITPSLTSPKRGGLHFGAASYGMSRYALVLPRNLGAPPLPHTFVFCTGHRP